MIHGDTEVSPLGATTGGSRNAIFGGGAVRQTALEMRERVLQIAAHTMEAAPEDLDIDHGVISVRGTPSVTKSLADIAQLAYLRRASYPTASSPGSRSRPASPPSAPRSPTPRTSAPARSTPTPVSSPCSATW